MSFVVVVWGAALETDMFKLLGSLNQLLVQW